MKKYEEIKKVELSSLYGEQTIEVMEREIAIMRSRYDELVKSLDRESKLIAIIDKLVEKGGY